MDGKMLARIGAAAFVGVVITATVIELSRNEEETAVRLSPPVAIAEPLDAALGVCRDMGEAATRDPVCLRIWARNRDRFLRQASPDRPAAPTVSATTAPSARAGETVTGKESTPADEQDLKPQPEPARPGTH